MMETMKQTTVTPPLSDPLATSIRTLDQEMEGILKQTNIPQSEKALLYQQLLQRYLTFVDQYRDRPLGRVETDTSSKRRTVTDVPMSTVITTSPSSSVVKTEERVLESVPPTMKRKAKLLLDHVKDASNMTWNAQGEIVIGGQRIKGSNLADLVNDVLRHRKHAETPQGWQSFLRVLKESNVPRELIGHSERWDWMHKKSSDDDDDEKEDKSPVTSLRTPTTDKSSQSTTPTSGRTKRRRRKPKQWIEY